MLWLSTALALQVVELPVQGPAETAGKLALRISDFPAGETLEWASPGGRWRVLRQNAVPPYLSRPLPAGTAIRSGTMVAHAPGVWTPADLAAWSGEGLRGARVVDLNGTDEELWAGTLGGGLARWDGHRWRHWTRREGLPGDFAIAVDVDAEHTWVATDQGLARLGPTGVHTWTSTDGLPDPYVQAVFVDGPRTWIGTYQGVAVLENDKIRTVLEPWSCFALLRGPDQRPWAGYEGLRGLPQGEPIEGISPDEVVYDTEPLPTGIWLATRDNGLLWLHEGQTEGIFQPPGGGVYAIARITQHLLLAAEEGGVWHLAGQERQHYSVEDGLPSAVVNEVIPGPGSTAWVGTDRGVAVLNPGDHAVSLPLAPLPAGVPVHGVVSTPHGVLVASADRVVGFDRVPRGSEAFAAALGPDALQLHWDGSGVWAFEARSALRLEDGALQRWELPAGEWVDAAVHPERVAVATASGVFYWVPGAKRFSALQRRPDLRSIALDPSGRLWGIQGEVVFRDAQGGTREWHTVAGPRDLALGSTAAWVAADGGLYRIGAEVEEVSAAWAAGAFVAVAAAGSVTWAATAEGVLYQVQGASHRAIDLRLYVDDIEVTGLVAELHRVWVLSRQGAFLIR